MEDYEREARHRLVSSDYSSGGVAFFGAVNEL